MAACGQVHLMGIRQGHPIVATTTTKEAEINGLKEIIQKEVHKMLDKTADRSTYLRAALQGCIPNATAMIPNTNHRWTFLEYSTNIVVGVGDANLCKDTTKIYQDQKGQVRRPG